MSDQKTEKPFVLDGTCTCTHAPNLHHWTGCGASGCACKATCAADQKR